MYVGFGLCVLEAYKRYLQELFKINANEVVSVISGKKKLTMPSKH